MLEANESLHVVDQIRDASRRGLVDVGYTGEEEPSYMYRPKPDLIAAGTPEQRWTAIAEAAEHFLVDFKDPLTGHPFPGLTGGLKRTQEVFGEAAFVRGVTTPLLLAGDSAITHEVEKLAPQAMMMGVPAADPRLGIESYGASANGFALGVSPLPQTSPEVFWEDGALRLSLVSKTDMKPHTTDESLDALKKALAGIERSHVRVVALEINPYLRYFRKRADGSVVWDPMEWLYYHPDEPGMPTTMKPFANTDVIQTAYRNEQAILNWLLEEYLPANPGSRFVSARELTRMAGPELSARASWSDVQALAADLDAQFKLHPNRTTDYLRAGDRFFSGAEAFELMAESLAGIKKDGSAPASLTPVAMHGPITVPNDMGPIRGSVTAREVIEAAAALAPGLRRTEWKRIPENAVPAYVQVGAVRVNSAQFLRLMAQVCADALPDRVLTLNAIEAHSDLSFRYPKNTPLIDQGMGWTLKPARLEWAPRGSAAGAP